MNKRLNPHKRPATQADVIRAKEKGIKEAITYAMAIMFTVLCDKEHADAESIKRIWGEVNDLSDSITQGYVSINDLIDTLRREYEIDI